MLFKIPPLLISGMHRSGTTLLVEILMKFGFFPGKRLDENLEATFFQRINEWVLRRSGGAWDNPNQVKFLLKSITAKNEVVRIIENEITSTRFSEYKKQKSNHKNEKVTLWGWKDPRNLFTISLWLEIFPELKIILIRRNGVDVANSLYNRNIMEKKLDSTGPYYIKPIKRRLREAINPIENYIFRTIRCETIKQCFNLWEEYQIQADGIFNKFPTKCLYISYEQLLQNGENVINQIEEFLNLKLQKIEKQIMIDKINSNHIYHFLQNGELCKFYTEIKDNYLMKKGGKFMEVWKIFYYNFIFYIILC